MKALSASQKAYVNLVAKIEHLSFSERTQAFSQPINDVLRGPRARYLRQIVSPMAPEVDVLDPVSGKIRRMLMFGSNNYLGLANHPYVCEKVDEAIKHYGSGLGCVPLLGGYMHLHRELEERLSDIKKCEDTLLFSSGYVANIALATTLLSKRDVIIADENVHASLRDGLHGRIPPIKFRHNSFGALSHLLDEHEPNTSQDVFVAVEGVYSMTGDLAPLDAIVPLCKRKKAILIMDDAHGEGVMGSRGRGTGEHFGVDGHIDVVMGTFSKAFAQVGGYVSGSCDLVNYLRILGRPYVFSTSLPPAVIAAVLAGLDVLEHEPERVARLHSNMRYAHASLRAIGVHHQSLSALIPLMLPEGSDIVEMALAFQAEGIFVNPVEYPAVPLDGQRFRINIMADHTHSDIDRLVEVVHKLGLGADRGSCNELFTAAATAGR